MEKPVTRILIIARDMVGDLVNTTGAVLQVRRKFPGAHITLEGGPPVAEIFANWPKQLEIWIRERGGGPQRKLKRIQRMKRGHFDLCLIFDDGHSHARLAKVAGISRRIGVHRGNPNVYTSSQPFNEDGHDLFDTLLFVLGQVGIEATMESIRPTLFPLELDDKVANDELSKLGPEPIGLNVSSTAVEKNWPDECWHTLIEQGKDFNFVMLGAQGEDLSRFNAKRVEKSLSILQFSSLLKGLGAVVTPDTGTAHLAATVGTPSIVLYGPTRFERFHPFLVRENSGTLSRRGELAASSPGSASPDPGLSGFDPSGVTLGSPIGGQITPLKSETQTFTCDHYGDGCAQRTTNGECSRACMLAISPDQVLSALTELLRAR